MTYRLLKLISAALLAAVCVAFAPRAAQAQAEPLPTCSIAQVQQAFAALPPYRPTSLPGWVQARENFFVIGDAVFYPQGVNYYPVRFPWRRFLTETDMNTVDRELDLITTSGLNTIRLYLWNDALFTCPGSGAIPVPAAFQRLDGIIQRAAARNLRVILSLNDMPDLENYPLYSNPAHVQAQTAFIVGRYRDEPAVMAWDVRNAGDIDYGIENNMQGQFTREAVLNWLSQTVNQIRAIDSRHLITAGWAIDSAATVPYVDFVSFAHWSKDVSLLRGRLVTLKNLVAKPVVLLSFGYSTSEMSEDEQAQTFDNTIDVLEENDVAGWVIWTAFDFPTDATCYPSPCQSPDNREHHFGLWRTDYTPKPIVGVLATG